VTYEIKIRRQARAEYLDAVAWYVERSTSAAARFTNEIGDLLDSVKENPFKFARVHEEIRRAVAPHFPYGVFFRVEVDQIVVLAIAHLARNPEIWQKRR
jgi:plasmid stabilization system protein ParE